MTVWAKCNRRTDAGVHERLCTKCAQWFPYTEDHFHRHSRTRLHGACKPCFRAQMREIARRRYWMDKYRPAAEDKAPSFDASALSAAFGKGLPR